MANKKVINLAELGVEELKEKIGEALKEQQQTRFNHAVTPVEDTNVFGNLRKQIARYKTELRARQLAEKEQS